MESAVIYARFSSRGQNEQSIEAQINICTELANKNGYKIINIYTDKARTGTNDARPAFQQMIRDAESGAFQYILVYMFDRFARNRRDSIIYKEMLKDKYGVKVISALEPIADDEGGEFYEMFLEWNAEKYSKRLSKRVKDGLDISVANGTFCGGHLIHGYQINLEPIPGKVGKFIKRVEINEEEAKLIRYIFEEYNKGIPKKDILEYLISHGYRNRDNTPIFMHQIDNWLKNPKYTGTFVFGGRVCDNMYPPIVSQELFDSVQKRLEANRYGCCGKTTRCPDFLLTGKVFCAYCGSPMTGDNGRGHLGVTYQYYSCKTARTKKTCHKKSEPKDNLEKSLTIMVVDFFSKQERMEQAVSNVYAYYEKRTDNTIIKSLETRMANIRKEVDEMAESYIKAKSKLLQDAIEKKMAEYEIMIEDIQTQHDQLLLERKYRVTKADMITFIKNLLSGDVEDKNYQRTIISALVSRVYVKDNGLFIISDLMTKSDCLELDFVDFNNPDLISNEVREDSPIARQSSLQGLLF